MQRQTIEELLQRNRELMRRIVLQQQTLQELMQRSPHLYDEAKEKREQRKLYDLNKKKTDEEKKKKNETVTEKTACGSGQRVFYPVCTKETYIENCM